MSLLGRERNPFVGLATAAIIGIVIADRFPVLNAFVIIVAIGGAIASLRWPFTLLVFGVTVATFFCLHSAHILHTPADALAHFAGAEVRAVAVTGTTTTEPKIEANGTATFLLRLGSARFDEQTIETTASVFVHWRGTPQIGDELALFGTLQPIDPPRNPGEFAMRDYLARRGITRELIIRYPENGHVTQSGRRFSVLRAAARSRDWMQRTLSRGLEDSPDVVGLICGTSLGLRHQTRDDIEEPFQQTGTLHLFAVAGLHVGIVAWLLWTVASVLRLPRKRATAIIIPLVFFYAAITGLHTASIRAAVMSALLMAGIFFDRKVLALNSLAAAAFLILLCDSNQLFTSGFQLSFCVVGTIILLADPLYRFFRKFTQPDPFLPRALFGNLRKWEITTSNAIARGASVSLAAWIGSLPCIYWYYHLVTPVSLLANLVVVPIAYFVLALALLSVIAAPFSSGLSIIFNNANWLMSRAVLALVHFFAAIPGGHFYLPETRAPVASTITVLDEGAGAASHIRAAGYDWLIDCGNDRSYERTLKPYLRSRGIKRLEGMLLTHGDSQHIGGAPGTIADFAPRELYDNPLSVRSVLQRHLLGRFPSRHLSRDDALLLGPTVSGKILYPPSGLRIESADDAPLIVQLSINGKTTLLFQSDAGVEAETALLHSGTDLKSDILIKGQHHDGISGTGEFIDAVRPELIVATSREFPLAEKLSEEWEKGIAGRGIKLLRQDQTGAIEIEFASREWQARSYLTGEIFRRSSR